MLTAADLFTINCRFSKRKDVSQRVRELSCTQTDRQTDMDFSFTDELAFAIAQPLVIAMTEK